MSETMQVSETVPVYDNKRFLHEARTVARYLLRMNPDGLGIDDIRDYCENIGIKPSNPTLWGAVVKSKKFVRNGDKRSHNKKCHGRWISIWKLRGL